MAKSGGFAGSRPLTPACAEFFPVFKGNQMAGVKGRSGGARPGAGRKPKPPAATAINDPLDFLRAVWKGEIQANPGQIRAATAALPFTHQKLAEGGKKDAAADAARKVAGGKFAAAAPPLRPPA